jgi:hypothetical protein
LPSVATSRAPVPSGHVRSLRSPTALRPIVPPARSVTHRPVPVVAEQAARPTMCSYTEVYTYIRELTSPCTLTLQTTHRKGNALNDGGQRPNDGDHRTVNEGHARRRGEGEGTVPDGGGEFGVASMKATPEDVAKLTRHRTRAHIAHFSLNEGHARRRGEGLLDRCGHRHVDTRLNEGHARRRGEVGSCVDHAALWQVHASMKATPEDVAKRFTSPPTCIRPARLNEGHARRRGEGNTSSPSVNSRSVSLNEGHARRRGEAVRVIGRK